MLKHTALKTSKENLIAEGMIKVSFRLAVVAMNTVTADENVIFLSIIDDAYMFDIDLTDVYSVKKSQKISRTYIRF